MHVLSLIKQFQKCVERTKKTNLYCEEHPSPNMVLIKTISFIPLSEIFYNIFFISCTYLYLFLLWAIFGGKHKFCFQDFQKTSEIKQNKMACKKTIFFEFLMGCILRGQLILKMLSLLVAHITSCFDRDLVIRKDIWIYCPR